MCSDSEKNMSAFADQNHAPSLTCVRLEKYKCVEREDINYENKWNSDAGINRVYIRDSKDEYRMIHVQQWIDDDESLAGTFGY